MVSGFGGQDRSQRLGLKAIVWAQPRRPYFLPPHPPKNSAALSCGLTGDVRGGVDPWAPGHKPFIVAWEISAFRRINTFKN
jgi:hypothetical protein